MRCIVHIGIEKTGTTSIQRALSQNRAVLEQQGVALGWPEEVENSRYLVAYFREKPDDFWAAREWQSAEDRLSSLEPLMAGLDEEIAKAPPSTEAMIFSSEHFHSRLTEESEIRALADFLGKRFETITIVCFVRPQASTVLSLYSTALRAGHAVPYRLFAQNMLGNREYLDHALTLSKWASAFGEARISVRPYPMRAEEGRDVRQDFFEAINMDHLAALLRLEEERANPALSMLQQLLLYVVNRMAKYPRRTGITVYRRSGLARWIEASRFLSVLPERKKLVVSITERFKESNRQVSKRFGISPSYWTNG